MAGRVWHRNAHPAWRRLRNWWRLTFTAALGKSHQVHFISVRGRQCKRVIFPDSAEARRCEANLEALATTGILPPVLLRHENEVWVDFIDGRPADPQQDRSAFEVFFATLYRQQPQQLTLLETPWQQRLERDLRFLASIGVLDVRKTSALLERAGAEAPQQVFVGYDFIDPVLKNFLFAADRIVAIDIEGLLEQQLLGHGVAKASLRWLTDSDRFLAALHALGAPDLRPQYRYAQLCFLADWTKMKVLQGKNAYVALEPFDAWLAQPA